MPYSNLKITLSELLKLPKLDVIPLWESDRWDGPISGICEYNNRKYWFQWVDDDEVDDLKESRAYAVIELTDEQIKWIEYWHEEFRKYVGTHSDYVKIPGKKLMRLNYGVRHSDWNLFYDRYKLEPKQDYSENKIIGYFYEH